MFVHGDNLEQKESHPTKYRSAEAKQYLAEIRAQYEIWKSENLKLIGPKKDETTDDLNIIEARVELFKTYKDFIDKQAYAEMFDSRSNLHSSVLEEFLYYLFKDLAKSISDNCLVGKSKTFKDLFFHPPSYAQMLERAHSYIETKDHDFIIGTRIDSKLTCAGITYGENVIINIPAVAIECKTYLDKTMLEGSSAAAEQLKIKNPNALYIVAAEWLKLTDSINLSKYKVDQIYVFRKQKNTDREFRYEADYVKNPIYADVVIHMFQSVRAHLTTDWGKGIAENLKTGILK